MTLKSIIPTLPPYFLFFFVILLSLHLVTFLMLLW